MKVLMAEYMDYNTIFQVGSHYYCKEFLKSGCSVTWLNQVVPINGEFKDERNEKLRVITPKVIAPFCKYPLLNSKFWADNYLKFSIPNIVNLLSEEYFDIVWLTNVKMLPLLKNVKYGKLIYRMADKFSAFPGAYKQMIDLEYQVIKKADLVIVTSSNLINDVVNINQNVIYIPNGVDIDRFNKIQEMPEEYLAIKDKPKIVYVGALDKWFDKELIKESARVLRDYEFIIIGNCDEEFISFYKDIENVKILGKKNHDEVASYLQYADVGIMPFVDNELTNSIHPLKVYEYMAAGIPCVVRNLDEVKNMKSPAFLYNDLNEFCINIRQSIKNKQHEAYVNYARQNTWNERFNRIINSFNK